MQLVFKMLDKVMSFYNLKLTKFQVAKSGFTQNWDNLRLSGKHSVADLSLISADYKQEMSQ